ncbi:riboflavin kinase-domain-containing protein [Lipomyces japonicus]|uniref:riboflavin kinase-domain-containing protein n=1 Tax=Lipomyces japonicus TaxID=56871 RepID=UPI0034CEA25D
MPIEPPYPVFIRSKVIPGFGRGSSDLGIPTANIPADDFTTSAVPHGQTGIYFGLAQVSGSYGSNNATNSPNKDDNDDSVTATANTSLISGQDAKVLPMVMSVGWNPFYQNKQASAEVHIVHKFVNQFYGANITIAVLGYIRPESDFVSIQALVDEINHDIEIMHDRLSQPEFAAVAADGAFSNT